ncbi:MAG TPA: PKD domain-containing protein [Methanocella sp.]|nr:PKD domain-containing protein [Methanocella sp.]
MVLVITMSMGPISALAHTADTLTASFSSDVSSGAAPLTVHFTDQSSGNPTGWHWDFGDGSSSTKQDPAYTFQTPGTYNVTLTVTDGSQSSSATTQIAVTSGPAITPQPIYVIPVHPGHAHPGRHHDQPVVGKPGHDDHKRKGK